jgi:hypothetical protein
MHLGCIGFYDPLSFLLTSQPVALFSLKDVTGFGAEKPEFRKPDLLTSVAV